MVYQVPPAKKSKDQDKFEFSLDGEKTFSLPSMKLLSPAEMAEFESASIRAMRCVFEKHAPGAFDAFETTEQLEGLTKAWAAESGVELGESSAS